MIVLGVVVVVFEIEDCVVFGDVILFEVLCIVLLVDIVFFELMILVYCD